ncbi:MAG: tetratricopeptide repeat protein [Magnetospirillum sp.]
MTPPTDILTDLGQFADGDVPLLATALALAQLHDDQTDDEDGEQIHHLIEQVRTAIFVKPDAQQMADALIEVLVEQNRFGLGGESGEGHEITGLLRERRASSDALCLLWLCVAQGAGFDVEMLAFPMHGLIRLNDSHGGRVIIECAQGRILDSAGLRFLHKLDSGPKAELDPAFFHALTPRQILLRWRQALKMHHLRNGRLQRALGLVESALLFAPAQAALWREAGLMRLRLEDLPGAAAALEQFIQREDNAIARGRGQQLLAEIRGRMR